MTDQEDKTVSDDAKKVETVAKKDGTATTDKINGVQVSSPLEKLLDSANISDAERQKR